MGLETRTNEGERHHHLNGCLKHRRYNRNANGQMNGHVINGHGPGHGPGHGIDHEYGIRQNGYYTNGVHDNKRQQTTIPITTSPKSHHSSSSSSSSSNYNYLKQMCKEQGVLFEDAQFQCNNKSLFGSSSSKKDSQIQKLSIQWLRPHQLVSRPKFINDGNGRFDIEEGDGPSIVNSSVNLGNASPLVSAISCLTLTPKLLDRVVPAEQSFNSSIYAGIFRFKFWKFGEWIEVVIGKFITIIKLLIYHYN